MTKKGPSKYLRIVEKTLKEIEARDDKYSKTHFLLFFVVMPKFICYIDKSHKFVFANLTQQIDAVIMPKKFSGENQKSASAKQRVQIAKEAEDIRVQKQLEDASWQEDDKKILRKQQRRENQERKRQSLREKKAESKAILEQELAALKPPKQIFKITRAQIDASIKACEKKPSLDQDQVPLEANTNREVAEVAARNVTDALAILNVNEEKVDRHPEKRRKSAYMLFEERRMTELKNLKPQLRISQLKDIIFKEWQKSSENPINKFGNM